MANIFFRWIYWITIIAICISLIPVSYLFREPFISFFDFIFSIGGILLITFFVIGFLVLFILSIINSTTNLNETLNKNLHVLFQIYISLFIGTVLIFSILCFSSLLFFLLGSLITLRYLGSVKTTTSNKDKEIFLIIKNMICNIILFVLSIAFLLQLLFISDFSFVKLIITPIIAIIFSLIGLIFPNINSSQQYRPFLKIKDATRIDKFDSFLKQTNIFTKTTQSIFGILLFFIIISASIIVVFLINGVSSENISSSQNFITLNTFITIESILLGFVTFFEIFIHFSFKYNFDIRSNNSNLMTVLNKIKIKYKEQRSHLHKTIFFSIISSLLLFIGLFFMEFFSKFASFTSLQSKLSGVGKHVIRFLFTLKLPFLIIIFLIILVILFLGLCSSGYVAKNPIEGFLAGILTGLIFVIWIYIFGLWDPWAVILFIILLILCPITNCLSGFLNWRWRGFPGINKYKKDISEKTKVSRN